MPSPMRIKIYNGSTYDAYHPETITSRVIGLHGHLNTLHNDIQTRVEKSRLHNHGNASGKIPVMDTNDKIEVAHLPEVAITGMKFQDVLNLNSDPVPTSPIKGDFWIMTAAAGESISHTFTASSTNRFKIYGVEHVEGEFTLQSGDWLVAVAVETNHVVWSIVDNNLKDQYLSKVGGTVEGNVNVNGNFYATTGNIPDLNLGSTETPRVLRAHASSGNLLYQDVEVVMETRTVNNKALSSNISLDADDVGAVPTARTVNGKALSSNITLDANDVGAVADTQGTVVDYLDVFASTAGNSNKLRINTSNHNNSRTGSLIMADIGASRNWTLPDASGTIALTGDITAEAVGLSNVSNYATATTATAVANSGNNDNLFMTPVATKAMVHEFASKIFAQASTPTGAQTGDLWFDTNIGGGEGDLVF